MSKKKHFTSMAARVQHDSEAIEKNPSDLSLAKAFGQALHGPARKLCGDMQGYFDDFQQGLDTLNATLQAVLADLVEMDGGKRVALERRMQHLNEFKAGAAKVDAAMANIHETEKKIRDIEDETLLYTNAARKLDAQYESTYLPAARSKADGSAAPLESARTMLANRESFMAGMRNGLATGRISVRHMMEMMEDHLEPLQETLRKFAKEETATLEALENVEKAVRQFHEGLDKPLKVGGRFRIKMPDGKPGL